MDVTLSTRTTSPHVSKTVWTLQQGPLHLVGAEVPGDAEVIKRLKEAGAVILGKAALTEW